MPLHVELLYNNYDYVGAFAVAALLALLALVTLALKSLLEWRYADELRRHRTGIDRRTPCRLIVDSVTKNFGRFPALNGVSLTAPQGAFRGAAGAVRLGQDHAAAHPGRAGVRRQRQRALRRSQLAGHAGARRRNAGFVFQHYALFRHMTVAENIAFGLKVRPRARPARRAPRSATGWRNLLDAGAAATAWADRYPSQLSGGQRQRVALARALAIEPRMLLLDEPFGALDAKVRKELRAWLRRIHDHAGVTTVFVTHDQEEAFAVADLVAVMKDGRIEQYGAPTDVRRNPKTAFVSEFLAA